MANVREGDMFQILVATDCHLGYLEKDALRGSDSMVTFEEILQIAVKEKVDFILLAGDLFHENKPSRKVLYECMSLLRKYCMGDRPIQFEFLSDQSINFKHSSHPIVNFEDPNLNIAIPVFSIHGNHDDPAGTGSYCSLDLLSASGLVNYFGKCVDLESVNISPLLLQKGKSKLSIYGLGSIRDERLHRMFREGKVSMLRPKEKTDDWFNLMLIHQNRAKHGPKNYIPEEFLDDFLNLIIWGHEHECRIDEEYNNQQKFHISQPGSSVATSLCQGEAVPKHVGLLQIYKKTFEMKKIPLKTVRQMYIADIDLESTELNLNEPDSTDKVSEYCKERVDGFLERATLEHSGHPKQPIQPLIRLRVFYPENFETFSVKRFGHSYVSKVANTKDIILFSRKKIERTKKESIIDSDVLRSILKQEGFDKSRVEDLVKKYFQQTDESKRLSVLSENGVSNAVQEYVDKESSDAISNLVSHQLQKAQKHLKEKEVEEKTINDEIVKFREERSRNTQDELAEFEAAMRVGKTHPSNGNSSVVADVDDDDPFADETIAIAANTKSRGRGRGRGRGTRAASKRIGRGSSTSSVSPPKQRNVSAVSSREALLPRAKRKAAETSTRQSQISSFFDRGASTMDDDCIDISDEEVQPKKRKTTASRRGIVYDLSD